MTLTRIISDGITDGAIVNADINASAAIAKTKLAALDIVNADVNASAAIAGTKISPNFGGQNILTTGQVQISGALPTIVLNDENNENDFNIQNINGTFAIGDIDAGAARLEINSSGVATFRKNLNALEGLDVTGAITGTGNLTIDTNTLHVDSSNNRVGIGTTSPTATLHVSGNTQFTTSTGVQHPFNFRNDFTPNSFRSDLLSTINVTSNNALRIGSVASSGGVTLQGNRANDSAAKVNLILNPDGANVGIGTTSPLRPLSIGTYGSGNAEIAFGSSTSGIASLLFGDGSTGTDIYRGYVQYSHGSDRLLLATGASVRGSFDSDGLKFNGDTAAANALSDYETGTFTPNNTIGMPFTNTHPARYIKIGNMCWINMDITWNSSPADTSQCGIIQNLPFTSETLTNGEQQLPIPFVSESGSNNLDHDLANTVFIIGSNESRIDIFNFGLGAVQSRAFLAGRRMRFNFCYKTA